MDRLATNGLRYNQFHTTALCSPSRAALLSGRNHHSVSTGVIMEAGTGFPGYNTLAPKSAGTFAEILKQNGYNTSWYGKNHNVPDWQSSAAGPFDLWPTGLGFEYFYGFIGGDTSQWNPAITEGTKPIEPSHDAKDYFFDKDMADRAIHWIRMQHATAPNKPFLAYYAPGTAHAPHHAPKEWIVKFKGKFDQGWDKVREETFARQKAAGLVPANAQLTERSAGIPAWDSLNADQKKVYAHMMEVYAAALAHCDHQMGRVLDAIEAQGELDNTLVIYIQGDNGASGEGGLQGLLNEMTFFNAIPEDFQEVLRRMDELGGPNTFNHYPVGWAHAMDTPFQWAKQVASHFGGTRNGLVISWPARIKDRGGIRSQFHHIIDIMPTILEAAGVPAPTSINGVPQKPVEGVSMAYTFDDAQAPSKRVTQYFEMLGNRAIYHDGWVATTTPPTPPWSSTGGDVAVLDYQWELYRITDDFTQANNLAAKEPAKLKELQELFWKEAEKYNVLPIDNSKVERLDVSNRPSLTAGRDTFTYFPGLVRIPEGAAPDIKNKSWRIEAEVVIPEGGAEGILAHSWRTFRRLRLLPARRQACVLLQPRGGRPLLRHGQGQAHAWQTYPRLRLQTRWRPRQRRHRYHRGGRQHRRYLPHRTHAALPPLTRRDTRLRRGHRHAGQRGLREKDALQIHRRTHAGRHQTPTHSEVMLSESRNPRADFETVSLPSALLECARSRNPLFAGGRDVSNMPGIAGSSMGLRPYWEHVAPVASESADSRMFANVMMT